MGKTLTPYQHTMLEHVLTVPKAALWVPMGSGKTVVTLTALQRLIESFDAHRVLIIAPLRVARKTWTDEINEWEHLDMDAQVLTGEMPPAKRKERLKNPPTLTILSISLVPWLVDACTRSGKLSHWPWDTVVIDEARGFKDTNTSRFRSLRRVLPHIQRMIQLTGTPAANGYHDLYGQLYLLDQGERLGRTKRTFEQAFFDVNEYTYQRTLRAGAADRINEKVKDICLSLRDEDLHGAPAVQYETLLCPLSDDGRMRYEEMESKELLELTEDVEIDAANAGVLFGKLRQLANGAIYDSEGNWHAIHSAKVDALLDLLERMDEPVIVTYQWKHDRERILAALEAHKSPLGYAPRVRVLSTAKDEDDWNSGEIDVLLLHPASAGHGLNLHKSGGRRLVHFGPTTDLDQYLQVNARLFGGHRGKGRQGVIWHLVAPGTIDERVMAMLDRKQQEQAGLIDATARTDWMVATAKELVEQRRRQGAFLI